MVAGTDVGLIDCIGQTTIMKPKGCVQWPTDSVKLDELFLTLLGVRQWCHGYRSTLGNERKEIVKMAISKRSWIARFAKPENTILGLTKLKIF